MLISALSAVGRFLAWCVVASMALASVEFMEFAMTASGKHTLTFAEFAQCYSSTYCAFFLLSVVLWCFVWFFMVWLGGIRSRIALLFLLTFLILLVLITDTADLLMKDSLAKICRSRSVLVGLFGFYALTASTILALVVGKLTRRSPGTSQGPRALVVCAFCLTEAAIFLWGKGAGLPYCRGASLWACFVALAAVTVAVVVWANRAPVRKGLLVLFAAVGVLAPLPWAVSAPASHARPISHSNPSHTVKHIVLITIDTLRADALGCYAPGDANTPHIDQLAQAGTRFTHAFSSAPWTLPSVASILTGTSPKVHQLTAAPNTLPEPLPTMAGYLQDAGYRTAAVGFNSILDSSSKLDRGFQEYRWYPASFITAKTFDFGLAQWLWTVATTRLASTRTLTDEAINWFKANAQDDSFFWLHYFDPHIPYTPPKAFCTAKTTSKTMGDRFNNVASIRSGHFGRTAEERTWVRGLYDAEVRYVDSEVGRLFDTLRELGIYDDALIILSSDHGEEFWEHEGFEHGHTLFNELLNVPLIVKCPGNRTGKTTDSYVSLQSILPTVLDLCGIGADRTQIAAAPLTPLLAETPAPFNEIPIETGSLLFFDEMDSVIFNHMKYVRSSISGHESLFDLTRDPQERASLATQDADNLAKGRELLESAAQAAARLKEQRGIAPPSNAPMSQQDVMALKALGYL